LNNLAQRSAEGGIVSLSETRNRRVDEDVTILIPHRSGCAGFPLQMWPATFDA
jgi:hypothetical protein